MSKFRLQAVCFNVFFAHFLAVSTACAAPDLSKNSDSLVYCTSVSGFSFNPQKADLGSNMNVVTEQIYDKLIEFDPKQNRLIPALAERFEVSEEGRLITFYLRQNVQFHHTKWFQPSRPFNADDVLFSLNRVMGKRVSASDEFDTQQRLAERTHFPFFESIDLKNKIAHISAPNENVVQIRLHKPDASFLAHLASQFAVILSKEYALQLQVSQHQAQLDLMPVGTGVYQLENYVQNEYVRLKPNPHYWGEPAHITNMIVDFSSSGTGRMAKFLNGECDVSSFPEPSQVAVVKPKQGYVVEQAGANLAYLGFNFDRPIGHDVVLRKQIARAINRQRIADRLFYGMAEVPQNVLPNALLNEPNSDSYPYYAEQSPTSTSLTLWVIDERRIYNLHPLKMAEMIRTDLSKVGIELDIRVVSRAYLTQQLAEGLADYDLILGGWLAYNFDPDSFLSPILACQAKHSVSNLANWCSEDFDQLLDYARHGEESDDRTLYYQQAQRLLEEQLPLLPLVNVKRVLLVGNGVKNVEVSPFGQVKLSQISGE